uniref:Putative secreted protein n=1 Tax=Anopheles darlingi TaxID=43151 RepID=A0A2M4D560_ANODA
MLVEMMAPLLWLWLLSQSEGCGARAKRAVSRYYCCRWCCHLMAFRRSRGIVVGVITQHREREEPSSSQTPATFQGFEWNSRRYFLPRSSCNNVVCIRDD